jgi:hypothetical protein
MESELIFAQLKAAGIVVDPSWQIDTLTPEALYTLAYECCRITIAAPPSSAGEARKRAYDTLRAEDPDRHAALQKSLKAVPPRLPAAMRDRFAACQALCTLAAEALSTGEIEYNAFMYPEPSRTSAVLQSLAHAVGEHAERVAAALTEQDEHAASRENFFDDVDVDTATRSRTSVASRVKRAMQSLRKTVDTVAPQECKISAAAIATENEEDPSAVTQPDVAAPAVPFHAAILKHPSHFGDGKKATLIAQLPSQSVAFASMLEYLAVQRLRTPAFEAERRQRLTTATAAKRAARFAKDTIAVDVTSGDAQANAPTTAPRALAAAFYGSAIDMDPRVADARREAAATAAAAEAAAEAEVADLQQTVESRREKRTLDEQELASSLKAAKTQVADLKALIKAEKAKVKDAQALIEAAEARRELAAEGWESRRADAEARKQLILDAADPATLANLEAQLEEARARQEAIKREFEAKLARVVRKHAKLRTSLEELRANSSTDQTLELKNTVKALKKALRASSAETAALERDWERCPKGIDRSKYARVVTDMSSSLRKQQVQIDDVHRQLHGQRSAIEVTKGSVKTVYNELEEHVYDQAKKESFAKDAYPRIIELREAYVGLVEVIEERGRTRREQHMLDARHAKLQKSVSYIDEADKAVSGDLQALKDEIQALQAQLKTWR